VGNRIIAVDMTEVTLASIASTLFSQTEVQELYTKVHGGGIEVTKVRNVQRRFNASHSLLFLGINGGELYQLVP
jgi:hypothetical protein